MIDATILHGGFPLITSGPVRSRGERGALDSVTWEVMVNADQEEADLEDCGFVEEKKVDDPAMHAIWVQTIDSEPDGEFLNKVTVRAVGLLKPGDKRRRKISVGGTEISVGPLEKVVIAWTDGEKGKDGESGTTVENVKRRVPKLDEYGEVEYKMITCAAGTAERWKIKEALVTVRDTYYVTTRPTMTEVNQNFTPVNPPDVPPYLWASYDKPLRYNSPNGWVLDDRQVDEIFADGGIGLWAVEDVMVYYYLAQPD